MDGEIKFDKEAKWHVTIKDMPHVQDFSYPVIEYSWEIGTLCGGTVRVWSLQSMIEVHSSRDCKKTSSLEGTFSTKEEAAYAITNSIAVLPPMFNETCDAMVALKKSYVENAYEPATICQFFDEVKTKWKELLAPYLG
jgi:hypothetical protein